MDDPELQKLYKEMGWEKFETEINGKPKEFLAMRVSDNPNDKNCMKTNMHLMCFWCSKDFNPYDEMVINEMKDGIGFAWGDYCSDRCARLHFKYGKIKEFFENIIRYAWWKPKYAVLDWYWSEYCPECFKDGEKLIKMNTMLAGDLYACHECWNEFEIRRKRFAILKQAHKKITRLLFYIQEGGKSAVLSEASKSCAG